MTFPKRGQPAYPGDGFSGIVAGSVFPRWWEMRRWIISGIVAVVCGSALAGCQTNAPAPTFGVDVPSATIRADAILKVSGLPAGTPAMVSGGLLPAAGVASARGVMTLAASLFPGHVNSLTVEAVVGSRLSTVPVKVTQSMSAADDHGAMSGRIVGPHGPIAGATIRYGQVVAQSASDGTFSLAGLPAGQVVAVITAPGYSPGVTAASVSNGGTATADETRLTPLPPETIVGPGRRLTGPGWQVAIPPGALDHNQALRVGRLRYTGLIDILGSPVLQIMPAGVKFLKPVTVTIDTKALGTAGSQAEAIDPTTLEVTHLKRGFLRIILQARGTEVGADTRPASEELEGSGPMPPLRVACSSQIELSIHQRHLPRGILPVGGLGALYDRLPYSRVGEPRSS